MDTRPVMEGWCNRRDGCRWPAAPLAYFPISASLYGAIQDGDGGAVIKVLLAEDMHLVRGALVALLDLESDIKVVSEVARGDEVLPNALTYTPDVALLDIDLPGKDGLTAATEIHENVPGCRTLILTGLGRSGTARRALTAKVHGYIHKDSSSDKLTNAIRQVAVGRRVMDNEVAFAAWASADCPLTCRELEVLRLVSVGHNVTDIAKQLHLSAGTVRNYLTTIVSKLNARNRVDAIRIAREAEWL